MCGLIGFYPKENKQVNLEKLLQMVLGSQNRGEDNTGISIGNMYYQKATGNANEFFATKYKELKEFDRERYLVNEPVLVHVRKASERHKVAIQHGHPFSWALPGEDGSLINYFYGVHNGTITNDYELHTKYIKPYNPESQRHLTHEVDSQVLLDGLFNAILHKEQDLQTILESYKGAASLLFYTKEVFYAWKGIEKSERPLFYVETEEGWYFCSIETLLKLFEENYTVVNVPNNSLLIFKNFQLVETRQFNRPEPVTTYATPLASYYDNYNHDDYWQPKSSKQDPIKTVAPPILHLENNKQIKTKKTVYNNIELTNNGIIVSKEKDLPGYLVTGWYEVTKENNLILLSHNQTNKENKIYISQSCLLLKKCPIETGLIAKDKIAEKTRYLYKLSSEYRTSQEPVKSAEKINHILEYLNPYIDTFLPMFGVTSNQDIYIKAAIIRDDRNTLTFVGPHSKTANFSNSSISFLGKKYTIQCKSQIDGNFSKIEIVNINQ